MTNPILKELHDIRDAILAEHRDDLADYLRAGLDETKASGHPIAKVKQRSIRRSGTLNPDVSSHEISEVLEDSHDQQ